jgi:hypothetical protein
MRATGSDEAKNPFSSPATMSCVALSLDRHKVLGATASDIAAAHELDLAVQD